MDSPLAWIDAELAALREEKLFRRRRVVTSLPDGRCEVEGRQLLNFAGNDYLSLRHDPRVIAAARDAFSAAGTGSGSSALVTGRTPWHATLEERLARFEGQEQAILFPTGYAANMGVLGALAGAEDVIYCDRLNHASLVDGSRVSGAKLRVYRRDELDNLSAQLAKGESFRRRLIVTDALFSMDGDCAPLPALCDLAERFHAILIVDEAHSTGVFGDHGRGVTEWQGVENRVTVRTGTLSKAIGALGGFVAGSPQLIEWLWNKSRSQIYSTALPGPVCAAAAAAIGIIEAEPQRRIELHERALEFRRLLRDANIETPAASIGPIVPVILQDPERATLLAGRMEARGYLVAAIRPPTVPHGTSRLRISLCAAHTADDLRNLAATLAEELRALEV
jgi:8-amino-7-oxononanoate synthase